MYNIKVVANSVDQPVYSVKTEPVASCPGSIVYILKWEALSVGLLEYDLMVGTFSVGLCPIFVFAWALSRHPRRQDYEQYGASVIFLNFFFDWRCLLLLDSYIVELWQL